MRRMIAMTLAGMIGLVGLTGCPPTEEEQQQPGQPDTTQPDTMEPDDTQTQGRQDQQEPLGVERERMSDQDLARQIEDRLQQEQQITAEGSDIQLSVQDGQVTLEGYVQSEQESQRAEQVAADVAGQQNVDNQLEIRDQAQQQQQQQQQQDQPLQDDPFGQQQP